GIRGAIVSGSVRDLTRIEALEFPVFHHGLGPRPAQKAHPGELGNPVRIEGVTIDTGDLIVADADGIAVVPHGLIDTVLADVERLERREAELIRVLQGGATTIEALGLE